MRLETPFPHQIPSRWKSRHLGESATLESDGNGNLLIHSQGTRRSPTMKIIRVAIAVLFVVLCAFLMGVFVGVLHAVGATR